MRNDQTWITYDPTPELLAASVGVTRRMQSLAMPTAARVPTKRIAPPGRLMGRMAVQAAGMRAAGNPTAAMRVEQFRGSYTDRKPLPPAVVGIMADVSGSMRWSTTGVGEAAWLLARGAAHAGARVASLVFGSGVDPVVFPGDVPQQIVVRSATDGTESPDLALAALDGALGLSTPTAKGAATSRVVVILSDMQWTPDQVRFFSLRARALAVTGVRFIVLGPALRGDEVSLPTEIRESLGIRTPLPGYLWDDTNPRHGELPYGLQRWAARPSNKGQTLPSDHEPRPLTGAERYASGTPLNRLPAMVVIPKELLGDHQKDRYGYAGGKMYGASRVRDQIISHTLLALEGME